MTRPPFRAGPGRRTDRHSCRWQARHSMPCRAARKILAAAQPWVATILPMICADAGSPAMAHRSSPDDWPLHRRSRMPPFRSGTVPAIRSAASLAERTLPSTREEALRRALKRARNASRLASVSDAVRSLALHHRGRIVERADHPRDIAQWTGLARGLHLVPQARPRNR